MGTNMQDIQFLSTLSLRRATIPFVQFLLHTPISIHALLAESDTQKDIYIIWECIFLSTLSLRRATFYNAQCPRVAIISIHALLAESDYYMQWDITDTVISIHALLAESDILGSESFKNAELFLSTLSLRRATVKCEWCGRLFTNFYPRSPCGERHGSKRQTYQLNEFLSTLSLRRATGIMVFCGPQGSDFYPRSPCGERPMGLDGRFKL